MSINRILACVFVIIFLVTESFAQFDLNDELIQTNGVSFSMDRFVNRVLDHFDDEDNPVAGYQIVFSKNGQLYHQESRGWAVHPNDNGGQGIPMETTTRFDVASVSKFICTLTLANVLDLNNIDWDESVAPYLPPSWVAQLAPEHLNPNSQCYLTFEKLIRHETCLGWPGDGSGPLGSTADDMLDYLTSANLNVAEYGDYQNGNFALARILISEILYGAFINENNANYDQVSVDLYYSAVDYLIFDPLNLSPPTSIADFDTFYSGLTPFRYPFPFNTGQTCNGSLGSEYSPTSPYVQAGSSGVVISSLELAAIMAYFIHDDSGTIIPPAQRDYILANGLGLSSSEWNGGNTIYGQYYAKGGSLTTTCGANPGIQRGFRTAVAAYPNGVEVSFTTNSRIDFRSAMLDEWEDAWTEPCAAFVHTATESTVENHFTMINDPELNGDPDRFVFASPIYRPGVGNISPIGVWYDGSRWGVFNQNFSPMPESQQYGIYSVPSNYPLAFTHLSEAENTFNHFTIIDHPLCNNRPEAELLVTQNWGSFPGVFNPHNVGVIYVGTKWAIINLDLDPIPAGAKFNVLVNEHYIDRKSASSPVNHTAVLISGFPNNNAKDDVIITTNVLEAQTPWNDAQVGTWFSDGDWYAYNSNFDAMSEGTLINYMRIHDGECCDDDLPSPVIYVDQDYNTYTQFASDTVYCFSDYDIPQMSAVTECQVVQIPEVNQTVYDPGGENTRVGLSFYPDFPEGGFTSLNLYVWLLDSIAPEFVGLEEQIATICSDGEPESVTAQDDCVDEVILSYEDELIGDACDYTLIRTWTASDFAGNSNVVMQMIFSAEDIDVDNDGFDLIEDCDDNDNSVFPGALEVCDGKDNNCDGFVDEQCVDCSVFELAPVDLNKSFNPVNGVVDRVQLKWYKASPEIRYSDEDAAACDIKIWPKRNLDPVTGNPIGSAIQSPDTIDIIDAKKNYGSGAPREIFKWPVKFRSDESNNKNRVDPNIRYEWQVRCACGHGDGPESPWSEVKIFNTPDFDPSTGIYDSESQEGFALKSLNPTFSIFPNPSDGSSVSIKVESENDAYLTIFDVNGRIILEESFKSTKEVTVIEFQNELSPGIYMVQLKDEVEVQKKVLVVH